MIEKTSFTSRVTSPWKARPSGQLRRAISARPIASIAVASRKIAGKTGPLLQAGEVLVTISMSWPT
jgi:hypothetical protein